MKKTINKAKWQPTKFIFAMIHQEASTSFLSSSIRGQTEWKSQSQKTNQTNHMGHSLVWLNETMSHAMWSHWRWTSHGGEFWQNGAHWRRERQTTSVFLPWEHHEHYKKAKRYDTESEFPRLVGAQYATGEEWGYSSRKKRLSQSKNNTQLWMWLVIEEKLKAVKNNIAKEPGC